MYEDLFYQRLSSLRGKKRVSARDMSLSLGQSENYINTIENRRAFPSMQAFFYICEYLGVEPKEFFDDDAENPMLLSKIIKCLRQLNDEQLTHIHALLEDFTAR